MSVVFENLKKGTHEIDHCKVLSAPIILTEKLFNNFGFWLQSQLKHSKFPFHYSYLLLIDETF